MPRAITGLAVIHNEVRSSERRVFSAIEDSSREFSSQVVESGGRLPISQEVAAPLPPPTAKHER